jgi:hypothetical protein
MFIIYGYMDIFKKEKFRMETVEERDLELDYFVVNVEEIFYKIF